MARLFAIALLLFPMQASLAQEQDALASNTLLVDARPPIQNKSGFESLNRVRCSYASRRLSDRDFGFDRIQSLRQVLISNFSNLSGTKIVVRNYVSHLNTYVVSKGLANRLFGAQVGGALGGAMTGPTSKSEDVIGCGADNLIGGYVVGEVTAEGSPLITVIDLEVDGRPFHFRSISQITGRDYGKAQNDAMDRLIPAFTSFMKSASIQR